MSIAASNWAWSQSLPPTQKVTLLALADQADDAGICWPSIKTIARKVCVDARTAQRNIRALQAAGLVGVEARRRPDGDATSNLYRLSLTALAQPPGKLPPPNPPRQIVGTPVALEPVGVVAPVSPQEPPVRSITRAAASRARDPASAAAANSHRRDEPAPARSTRLRRVSGIVCWVDPARGLDDLPEAEKVEANATSDEIQVAVSEVEATGKSPVPGLIWASILRRRAALEIAMRAKVREASGPLAEARRQAAERERREADPVARQAGLAAREKAAKELGFGDLRLGEGS